MPDAGPGPLVDAHHHVWDLARRPHPWLGEPGHEALRRPFGIDDLRRDAARGLAGRAVTSTVLVQCLPSVAETEDLLALAGADPLVGAVTGWVDLTAPDVGEVLDRLVEGPGGGALRGIRHLVQAEADPAWLLRPDVGRGLRAVAERGLVYELLVRPHQLPAAAALAARLPQLRLVLDHAGKPDVAGGDLRAWSAGLRGLAGAGQVVCKVSGLVTEADHQRWRLADLVPVWDVLMTTFGPQRLAFGSDWPVCRLAGGWAAWAEAVEALLAGLGDDDAGAVLAGTATTTYLEERP